MTARCWTLSISKGTKGDLSGFKRVASAALLSFAYNMNWEALTLRLNDLFHQIKPPCDKCPYKLGLVYTVVNPCPQCKANGYQTFEIFQQQATGDYPTSGEERE